MKAKLNLSGEGIKAFLFNNGEKLVLGATALILLFFLYGAITAKPLDDSLSPQKIATRSAEKKGILGGQEKIPEPEFVVPNFEKAASISIEPVPTPLLAFTNPWNRPVFPELKLRTEPVFFPIEEPQASGVVGIVPHLLTDPAGGVGGVGIPAPMMRQPQRGGSGHDDEYDSRQPAGARRGPVGAGGAATAIQPKAGSSAYGVHAPGMDPRPKGMAVITALLPVEKQTEAYRQKFEDALPSGQYEPPVYQWFTVERTEVKDAADKNFVWAPIPDPAKPPEPFTYGKALKETSSWAGPTPEPADPRYVCPQEQINIPGRAEPVMTYMTWPLPPMYLKNWGINAVHPKVPLFKPQEVAAAGPTADAPAIDFSIPGASVPVAPGAVAGQANANGVQEPPPPPTRLFRYVDTTARPGKTYRYRVQLTIANPNYINTLNLTNTLKPQHLANPQQGLVFSSTSPWSEPTPPVTIPRAYRLLADSVTPGGRGVEPKAKIDILSIVKTAAFDNGAIGAAPPAAPPPGAAAPAAAAGATAKPDVWLEVIKDTEVPLGGIAYLADISIEKVFDPTIEQERKAEKLTLNTNNSMLLDLRNEDPLGATKSKGLSEMLFLDAEGRLVAINSHADAPVRKDYKERTTPAAEPVLGGGALPTSGPPPVVRPQPIPAAAPVAPDRRRGGG